MGSKKKPVVQEQPVAAPVAPETPEAQAPEVSVDPTPETPQVQETPQQQAPETPEAQAPEEQEEDPQAAVKQRVKDLLKAFPTLAEGYVCAKGVYFVRELAEKALEEGEELIIVEREK